MLLPTTINVVDKFPTEKAKNGTLNYYMPGAQQYNEKGELAPVKDLSGFVRKWILKNYEAGTPWYAGSHTYNNSVVHLESITASDRDRLYELGYNPIMQVPGIGPCIWECNIAGSTTLLPELVAVVDYFISIDNALKKVDSINCATHQEFAARVMHFAQYAANDLLRWRHFKDYHTEYFAGNPVVLFEPTHWNFRDEKCRLTINVIDDHLYVNHRLVELVDLASKLYPEFCKYEGDRYYTFLGRPILGWH